MQNKKITLTTIKSFIKREIKNDNLYIKQLSDFDGMVDGVRDVKDDFTKVKYKVEDADRNSLGIPGAWFVKQSSDSFRTYSDDNYIGYEIYNCCGSFILAMRRLYAPYHYSKNQ